MEETFSAISNLGYDGAELMTLDPGKLNWSEVRDTAAKYGLCIPLVCTGEVFGQLGLSFTEHDENVRWQAVERIKNIIDFAGFLGANINIGRVRGQYRHSIPKERTYQWAVEAFRAISGHAALKGVKIALETVTIMQINFINTLSEAAQMVEDVGRDNFRLMMDVFHMNIEEKDLFAAIRDYQSYNIHVHLADSNRRYPGHCGMDFEKVLRTFCEVGYDGVFCTEIFQLPDQEAAVKGAMEYLAPIFERVYGRNRSR